MAKPESLKQVRYRYERADSNRRFEIELFWKRSAFFWGFLTAAYTAFFILLNDSINLALLVGCFGAIASQVWFLANRASSFWQKVWEQNLMEDEVRVLGKSVYDSVPHESSLGSSNSQIMGWKRHSLSGLTTAFSFYALMFWIALLLIPIWRNAKLILDSNAGLSEFGSISFLILTLCFGAHIYMESLSHPSVPSAKEKKADEALR